MDERNDGVELYATFVRARDSRVVEKRERLVGKPVAAGMEVSAQARESVRPEMGARRSVKDILGRGPGDVRESLVGTGRGREKEEVSLISYLGGLWTDGYSYDTLRLMMMLIAACTNRS